MDCRAFSDLAFYHLLSRLNTFESGMTWDLLSTYHQELNSIRTTPVQEWAQQLKEAKGDSSFTFLGASPRARGLKEPLFKVAAQVKRESINWQNKEAIEQLWRDPLFWQQVNLLEPKLTTSPGNRRAVRSPLELIRDLQDIFEKEFLQRSRRANQFFEQLFKKGFLSPQESREIEQLQKQLKTLTYHEGITASHKIHGIRTLRDKMKDFQSTLPINSRQITAFLTLGQQIKRGVEVFYDVILSLRETGESLVYLSGILPAGEIPLLAYGDWTGLVVEHKRDLQRVVLLTDPLFLDEISRHLHKEGWDRELINLLPASAELHRLVMSYPQEWQDVVDVYRTFSGFVREFERALQSWELSLATNA